MRRMVHTILLRRRLCAKVYCYCFNLEEIVLSGSHACDAACLGEVCYCCTKLQSKRFAICHVAFIMVTQTM